MTGTINQLLSTLAPKAPKIILSIKNDQFFFSPNIWQMMIFLNPLDVLIPKIPFSFFAHFWVTSEARGSTSVGYRGVLSIEPFWGGV